MNGMRWTLSSLVALSLLLPGRGLLAQDTSAGREAAPAEHTVAVLRPSEGPLREVGDLHAESVRRVFGLGSGNATVIRGHDVTFLVESTGNPVADTLHEKCAETARRAVEEEGAVAVLGPVSSGCTRRVLSLGLDVPVLSSLSTSRSLGEGDEWFFRTIPHDRRRLETFIDTARARGLPIHSSIAIHERSEYGEGLLTHLRELVPSVDTAHTFRWDSVFGPPGHEVEVTESFRCEMAAHHTIGTVFVLASSESMVDHVRALEEMFGALGEGAACEGASHHAEAHAEESHPAENDPAFVLVGSTEPANSLPDGSWLVVEAQVATSPNLVSELRAEELPGDLYVSSLDAALALRDALDDVFRGPRELTTPDSVRLALRERLRQNTFASAERGRSFEFVDGEISPTPRVPIRRVSVVEERRVESVNPEMPIPWVEVRVRGDRPGGHLEGPIVVDLVPQGEGMVNETVTLQVHGVADEPVSVEEVELSRSGATVSFTPSFFAGNWFPASFQIGTDRTPEQERARIEDLGWPVSYAVALLSALVGAVLYLRYRSPDDAEAGEEGKRKRRRTWSFAERCIAGLLIAFLIIHIGPLLQGEPGLSQIPIPQFGSSRWLNAFASGLLGGWLGLNPILGLASSLVGGFAALFQGEG